MADWQLKVIGMTPSTKCLTPGARVQLGFCNVNSNIVTEHLWVRTSQVMWAGKFYFGALEEDAKHIEGLKAGQPVQFWPKHVAKVRRTYQDDVH